MRADGYPWLHYEISQLPNEGDLQSGWYDEDDLGHLISQCLWMWQGIFTWFDMSDRTIINLPHAFCRLHEGIVLTNACTGRRYEIVNVLAQMRDFLYTKPPIAGVPESIKIPRRFWVHGYHPGELTGGTVQLKPLDGEDIDLDIDKGHFLSLPESNRPSCRLIYSELPDKSEGKGTEDRMAASRSGFDIEMVLTSSTPNEDRLPMGDTRGQKPRPYKAKRNRDTVKDPNVPDKIKSHTLDSFMEFNIKGPSAVEVGVMARWFKMFMWRYEPVIRRAGFRHILYDARFGGKIAPLRKMEGGDMTRLRYVFRWENFLPVRGQKLRKVRLETSLDKKEGTPKENVIQENLEI
jgi:hypothetical protein